MKAVFFDAGGTLVHIDYPRVAAIAGRVLGRRVDPVALAAAEASGRLAVEEAMDAGMAATDSSRWQLHFQVVMRAVGIDGPEFRKVGPQVIAEHKRDNLWSAVEPGTGEALTSLNAAGWLVACISNADGTVESLLERVGLRRHLAFVVDSGAVGIEKPDPRIFALALERAGMSAAESYYVGDIYPVDVVGSRAAGMVPVLLDPFGRHGDRGCRTATDVAAFCRELVSATA
ncbi:MAG: HAD family hydrolase, partial [Gemmatimonadales bacterium]